MEPRTHARGNDHGSDWRGKALPASMEPRTHARGNFKFSTERGRKYGLQWSHALTRVETSSGPDQSGQGLASFNGATHSRAWKREYLCEAYNPVYGFNGATHSRAWKLRHLAIRRALIRLLQWSHALTRVETKSQSKLRDTAMALQWSHALTRVETGMMI